MIRITGLFIGHLLGSILTLLIHSVFVYFIWIFLLADITGITPNLGDVAGALAIIYSIINYTVISNANTKTKRTIE